MLISLSLQVTNNALELLDTLSTVPNFLYQVFSC